MAPNQVPCTLVTESEKNSGVRTCLYLTLMGEGRWVEEGRAELQWRRKYQMQYVFALTF